MGFSPPLPLPTPCSRVLSLSNTFFLIHNSIFPMFEKIWNKKNLMRRESLMHKTTLTDSSLLSSLYLHNLYSNENAAGRSFILANIFVTRQRQTGSYRNASAKSSLQPLLSYCSYPRQDQRVPNFQNSHKQAAAVSPRTFLTGSTPLICSWVTLLSC